MKDKAFLRKKLEIFYGWETDECVFILDLLNPFNYL